MSTQMTMTQLTLRAQAHVLDSVATWSESPDEPTGTYGWVPAEYLRRRASALRIMAHVSEEAEGGSTE